MEKTDSVTITLHVPLEKLEHLDRVAFYTSRDRGDVINEALDLFLKKWIEEFAKIDEAVDEGIADIEAGRYEEFHSPDELRERFKIRPERCRR